MRGALLSLVFAVAVQAPPALAASVRCDGVNATVAADERSDARRTCRAIEATHPAMQECGLETDRHITITLVPEITHQGAVCLGRYACETHDIEVVEPDHLRAALASDSILNRLDAGDLFDGLVVHEWSHAMLDEVTDDRRLSTADQEYVAYAMQLSTMPAEQRATWLKAYPTSSTLDPRGINGLVALIDPAAFAARSWRYFSGRGGCETVRDIIDGRLSFRTRAM